MPNVQPSPFARDDTLFGVCQALGEDFGFNPVWLRLALGLGVIASPVAVVCGYTALAVVLALIHWLMPNPRPAIAAQAPGTDAARPTARVDHDAGMAMAA